MKSILKNEKGAILLLTVAIIMILVSLASSISLVSTVESDHSLMHTQHDAIQEELLLRSESKRIMYLMKYHEHPSSVIEPLPGRSVKIETDDRRTEYKIANNKRTVMVENFMGFVTESAKSVTSLITASRNGNVSVVRRLAEKLMKNNSLAKYQYFTYTEESENADYSQESAAVKFWGPDVLNGPVHSNSDIWIQQGGGGTNEGWPTFNAFVTTTGIFKNYNQGGAPLTEGQKEQIFLGDPYPGYEENAAPSEFLATAADVRANGIQAFDNVDIAYVKMEGSSFTSRVASVEFVGMEEFEVYSWYPADAGLANAVVDFGGNWFEDSDNIWTNHIAIYDTIWSEGPSGSMAGNSYFVDCELWIEGELSGATTFASSDTVFIVGDITYANTQVGDAPDDPDNANLYDYFGLVSEQKILVRYKHRDPFEDMILRNDNCNDINLYGAFAAIGKGNVELYGPSNCHYEGIFSFQYHHPHGSTPGYTAASPYNGLDTLYSYVDFHKFIFPIYSFIPPDYNRFRLHSNNPDLGSGLICGYPIEGGGFPDPNGYNGSYPNNEPYAGFPYGTDYPWYNPVWPESSLDIVGERGSIHMWGAIAQYRRGFIHRSGQDPYNHGTFHSDSDGDCAECQYDLNNFLYGGVHRINGQGIGYEKDYSYDKRLLYVQPPDYPEVYDGFGGNSLSAFKAENWIFKTPN